MNKTVKIDGEEYELVAINEDGWGNADYALRPVGASKAEEWWISYEFAYKSCNPPVKVGKAFNYEPMSLDDKFRVIRPMKREDVERELKKLGYLNPSLLDRLQDMGLIR